MYDFTYHKASSVADAAAKAKGNDDAKFMAGGQTLIPTLKQRLARPSDVIDLAAIADLKSIAAGGGAVTLGAMATHASVAASADIKKAIPALAALAEGIGDPQVRNRGTVGGSVANNDPAADYPAAVLGLGATIHTDQRQIAADDFFLSVFTTALNPGGRRSPTRVIAGSGGGGDCVISTTSLPKVSPWNGCCPASNS